MKPFYKLKGKRPFTKSWATEDSLISHPTVLKSAFYPALFNQMREGFENIDHMRELKSKHPFTFNFKQRVGIANLDNSHRYGLLDRYFTDTFTKTFNMLKNNPEIDYFFLRNTSETFSFGTPLQSKFLI